MADMAAMVTGGGRLKRKRSTSSVTASTASLSSGSDNEKKEEGPRHIIQSQGSVAALQATLQAANSIVVVVGAGISVSCG